MANTRKEDFLSRQIEISDFAKALSHPARIAILQTLAKKKECICGELVTHLPLAQSTVSQHLRALKEMGLIKGTIDGPSSRYCINWQEFEKYEALFGRWSKELLKLKTENQC